MDNSLIQIIKHKPLNEIRRYGLQYFKSTVQDQVFKKKKKKTQSTIVLKRWFQEQKLYFSFREGRIQIMQEF